MVQVFIFPCSTDQLRLSGFSKRTFMIIWKSMFRHFVCPGLLSICYKHISHSLHREIFLSVDLFQIKKWLRVFTRRSFCHAAWRIINFYGNLYLFGNIIVNFTIFIREVNFTPIDRLKCAFCICFLGSIKDLKSSEIFSLSFRSAMNYLRSIYRSSNYCLSVFLLNLKTAILASFRDSD